MSKDHFIRLESDSVTYDTAQERYTHYTTMATEYRVAIVGKAGTGKSSLGNSLLGKKIFKSAKSAASTTQQCELGEGQTSIGKLLVVDTPGLFDTVRPNDVTIKELIKCIGILAPGPHVFIFVLSVDRFTRDDIETVDTLKQMLGDGTMHHIIVVFTRKDHLEDDGITVEDYISDTPDFLKRLLKDVNSRYEFICNKEKGSHHQDVENVLSLIKKTVQQNSDRYYQQAMFQTAEDVIQKEMQERQKKEKKSDEECRREIRKDFVNNEPSIFSKVADAFSKIIEAVSPIAIAFIKAFVGRKK